MIAAHHDYECGITPVSLGQAEWLPQAFVEAVRTVRGLVAQERVNRATKEAG